MDKDNMNAPSSLNLPIGHLLVVWDVLSNRLSDTTYKEVFSEEEKRAIWALEDLCEQELVKQGYGERPEMEWNHLLQQATQYVKSIPVEFVE